MSEFIIYYTFDYSDDFNINMLLCSIISCIKLKVIIFVYTTNTDILTSEINKRSSKILESIQLKYYDYTLYGHVIQDRKKLNNKHFSIIGHSRYFIAKKLLQEYKIPIIYMDNDTGIRFKYDKIYDYVNRQQKPRGYVRETFSTFKSMLSNGRRISNSSRFINVITNALRQKMNSINCGLIVFPYNDFTITFVNELIDYQNLFSKNIINIYNDQMSLTYLYYKYKLTKTIMGKNMDNVIKKKELTKIPYFIHYYYGKNKFTRYKHIVKTVIEHFNNNKVVDYSNWKWDDTLIKHIYF